MVLGLIFGNNDTRAFIGAGIYFFLLGQSGKFKNFNSFINHIAFRFFGGLGILIYVVNDKVWNPIFVGLSFLIVLGLIFINVNKIKNSRRYNRREQITENILIF